jgi:diacylglycerol kinase family enzyme
MSRHRHVRIESDIPIPAQIDGEVIVDDRFEVGVLHAALDVVVPRQGS